MKETNINYFSKFLQFTGALAAFYFLFFSTVSLSAEPLRSEDISRRISQQQQKLDIVRQQLDELNGDILEKEKMLARNRLELADASSRLTEAEDRYDQSLELFNDRISAIYKLGDGKFYAVLLSSEDFSEAVVRLSYLATISESDLKIIDKVKSQEKELRSLRDQVGSLKQAQAGDLSGLRQQKLATELQVADGQKAIDAGMAEMIKARTREQEEEARLAAEQANSQATFLGPYGDVFGPSILAASGLPQDMQPSGVILKGTASWYGPGFHGNRTANGEIYDQSAMTAAHKTLPFGTWLKVTYNRRSVFVRINDRGPYIPGRFLDLSAGSARALGLTGVGNVTAEIYR